MSVRVKGAGFCSFLWVCATLAVAGTVVASDSVVISFEDWEPDTYVFLPGCAYNGNRDMTRRVVRPYPPRVSREGSGPEPKLEMTEVPALEPDGSGRIEVTTGDLATPCAGFFFPKARKGVLVFTEQQVCGRNIGYTVERGHLRIDYPARRSRAYRFCSAWAENPDPQLPDDEKRKVEQTYRRLDFAAADVSEFLERFFRERRHLVPGRRVRAAFGPTWRTAEAFWNSDGWNGVHYCPEWLRKWASGWTGGMSTVYALARLGSPLTRERCVKTVDFAVSRQAPSGFYYAVVMDMTNVQQRVGYVGTDVSTRALTRSSAEALYYLLKTFDVLAPKPEWKDSARRCADAFVRLWERYGQIGQWIDAETGELTVGRSDCGAMVPAALAEASIRLSEPKYLTVAEAVLDDYCRRDLSRGVVYGGPGDALMAADSESIASLLESCVRLAEVTGKAKWIAEARRAAALLSTWTVSYSYRFPDKSLFGRLGIDTVGAVFANVQNKHAAPGLCTCSPDSLTRLARLTGDVAYRELGLEIASFIPQCMSTVERPLWAKGAKAPMPPGWINERVNMSDWEGFGRVGEIFHGRCWCNTALVLSLADVPEAFDAAEGATVYVSPDGDDANDGSVAKPVASLSRAAERARELRRGGAAVEVVLEDGVWRLDAPLTLGKDDSGTAAQPVVWRAAHRGKAVLTGAAALDWRPRADGLFAATVPGTEPLPGFFMGGCMHNYEKRFDKPIFLVQDGRLLPIARYPNDGWLHATEFAGGVVTTNRHGGVFVQRKDASAKLEAEPDRIAKWAAEPDLWAYGLWHAEWADARLKVTNVDIRTGFFSVRQDYPYPLKDGYPYRIENAVCEIDQSGEWALDRVRRRLTLMKKGDGFPVAALQLNLLAVRDASDIVFDGLAFECSRGDAVLLDHCRNVTLRGCSVRQTGGWGVKVTGGARCRVEGCDMWELGEGGVRLEGGDLKSLEPAEHVADNNHIRHYGRFIANYRPGVALYGVGNSATHNLIHHSEHQALYFSGNDHYLGYNVLHDLCQHNNDAGAIYCCQYHWTKCGTVVEHNLVHMVGRKPRPTHCEAVYLDDFSSGTIVRGNILVRASSGVQMGGGHCSLVQSNVIVRTQDSPVKFASRGPGSFADRGGKGGMRDGYRGGNFRNLNAMRPSIERYPEKWNRYPHLLDNYTVRPPEGDKTDPGYWAHHQLWSEIVGNLYVCTPEFEHRYFDKVSAYNVYTNNVMTSEDPGFADYAGLDFSAKKGGAYESLIAYCDFPKMGLYESPARFSPAVKFGTDRSDPEPLKRMYALPVARVDVILRPVGVPDGMELVEQMEGCTVPPWAKGRRICMTDSPIVTDEWREYAFSFVPTVDLDVTLDVRGAVGEKTQYDDFRMTGGELVNGDCSTSDGWKCQKELPKNSTADLTPPFGLVDGTLVANHDVITLQTVRVRRGRRVELRFRARAFVPAASAAFKLDRSVMSDAYWAIWNEAEQNRLDSDIEKYRKANAEVEIDAPVGTEVSVEQLSHAFYFGAQIFNYGQLGKKEWNDRYKALYGTVFNSATVAFYWSNFEPLPNCPRFRPTYEDSEEFWNTCENPYLQRHWRRPATDAPVNWCRSRGVRIHGHPLVYLAGNTPIWLWGQFFPQEERDRVGFPEVPPDAFLATFDAWRDKSLKPWLAEFRKTHDEEDFGRLAPVFTANLRRLQAKRIAEISAYYGDRVDSWDVVNETRNSIDLDRPIPSGRPVVFGETGLEGGDFVYNAFKSAEAGFPRSVRLNINDNLIDDRYTNEIARLIAAGAKIDVIGMQMHMFDTNILHEIAQTGGERTTSGLFTRSMEPKPVFRMMEDLICREWKTRTRAKVKGERRTISFRGFKGRYRLAWKDTNGKERSRHVVVK